MFTEATNHYVWLENHLPTMFEALGLDGNVQGLIVAHGDKTRQYSVKWEQAGIPFYYGTAIYLLGRAYYESEMYQSGVNPGQWVIDNYDQFADYLPPLPDDMEK